MTNDPPPTSWPTHDARANWTKWTHQESDRLRLIKAGRQLPGGFERPKTRCNAAEVYRWRQATSLAGVGLEQTVPSVSPSAIRQPSAIESARNP